jgi:ribosomal protein S4
MKFFINTNNLQKINKKKNIFFKKKYRTKILVSKRLSLILRKRKKFKLFKTKKVDKGNFFFKKFFFKTLLKSRKFIKGFFFYNNKIRQARISKSIKHNTSNTLSRNLTYEYTLLNVLLRSHLCIFVKDALYLIQNNFLYLNGKVVNKYDIIITEQDIIQIKITTILLKYILFSKKLLKRKIALFRLNS